MDATSRPFERTPSAEPDAMTRVALDCIRCFDPSQRVTAAETILANIVDDAEPLFQAAHRLRLLHPVAVAFEAAGCADSSSKFLRFAELSRRVVALQLACWEEIHLQLEAAGVEHLLLKGFAVTQEACRDIVPAFGNDFDILFHRRDHDAMDRVFRDCGYSQRLFNMEGRLRRVPLHLLQPARFAESRCYAWSPYTCVIEAPELTEMRSYILENRLGKPFLFDADAAYLSIEIDPHFNIADDTAGVSLRELASQPEVLWRSPRSVKVGETFTRTLCDSIYAWLLPVRVYTDIRFGTKRNAKLLGNTLSWLMTHPVDDEDLLAVADTYNVEAPLYYFYQFAKNMGLPVHDDLLRRLKTQRQDKFVRTKHWAHRDPGDFLHYLVS